MGNQMRHLVEIGQDLGIGILNTIKLRQLFGVAKPWVLNDTYALLYSD